MSSVRLLSIAVILLFTLRCEAETENKSLTQTIPISSVWAYEMPGTRDVKKLEPETFGDASQALSSDEKSRRLHDSMIMKIRESLHAKGSIGPCFAVSGSGEDALKQAYQAFVDKKKPVQSLRDSDSLSIVFYSRPLGSVVALRTVQLTGQTFRIEYAFIPHRETYATEQFALIPVGKLSGGSYEIQIQQVQRDPHNVVEPESQITTAKSICSSGKFSVSDN